MAVALSLIDGVGEAVGVALSLIDGVGVALSLIDGVGVGVAVALSLIEGVGVAVALSLIDGVCEGVPVALSLIVGDGVALLLTVGVTKHVHVCKSHWPTHAASWPTSHCSPSSKMPSLHTASAPCTSVLAMSAMHRNSLMLVDQTTKHTNATRPRACT